MSPHYDRNADRSAAQNDFDESADNDFEADALEVAAEAMRQADIEAAQEESEATPALPDAAQLERMSIDKLRVLAKQLDVPNRSTITEQDELIAAIRRRL